MTLESTPFSFLSTNNKQPQQPHTIMTKTERLNQHLIQESAHRKASVDLIRTLIDIGADVNAQAQEGDYGTALIAAAFEGNLDIVKLLLEAGADVNAQSREGDYSTALIAAAGRGKASIVKLLLEAGAMRAVL